MKTRIYFSPLPGSKSSKFFRSVSTACVLAILLLILGAMLGTQEVQAALGGSFPIGCFTGFPDECIFRFNSTASIFWLVLLLFVLLFLGREIAINNIANVERREFLDAISRAPSPDLLADFHAVYDILTEAAHANALKRDQIAIELAILKGLAGLISLVKAYQPSWSDSHRKRYAATVMRFRPIASLSDEETKSYAKQMEGLLYNNTSLDELEGVLEHVLGLSIVEKGMEITSPDPFLCVEVLPVPVEKKSAKYPSLSRVLVGAPLGFVKGFAEITDTNMLKGIYQDQTKYDLTPSAINREHEFFTNTPGGKLMRSLIAVSFGRGDSTNKGVISIHCDHPSIFVSNERFDHFISLSKPLREEIRKLIDMR